MGHKKSILITRNLSAGSKLKAWALQKEVSLLEQSFIKTTVISGLTIPETDWIFFSSPQGANLYLQHYPIKARKVAALSAGTAGELERLGVKASFIGSSDRFTKNIGADFFSTVPENESVFFPLSDLSRRNVSVQKRGHQVIELTVYKTEMEAVKLDFRPDMILFTSPSNVDGYLLQNELEEGIQVLAIGETTLDHLKKKGCPMVFCAKSTDEEALCHLMEVGMRI